MPKFYSQPEMHAKFKSGSPFVNSINFEIFKI